MGKVIVLYPFEAQPNSSELSLQQDEILEVKSKDIGEGWWEGVNSKGERGLFPAGYVKEIGDSSELPTQQTENFYTNIQEPIYTNRSLSNFTPSSSASKAETTTNNPIKSISHVEEPDWPDDEWDDDDDDSVDNVSQYNQPVQKGSGIQHGSSYYSSAAYTYPSQYEQQNFNFTPVDSLVTQSTHLNINSEKASANIKTRRTFIKFSNSVKTGLEKFLLEPKRIDVMPDKRAYIQHDDELGIVWKPSHMIYSCAVSKHGEEFKMAGLKKYISYEITPSTTNVSVRRRYKHFDWLMQRLEEKFIFSSLPPLPEKQISGRFQEDFVEHRRNILQLFINYITKHPVLSQCDVWWHFITCGTDDPKGWKNGKRKAEKDDLVGGNFFHSVEIHPNVPQLDLVKTSKQLENFHKFVGKFDDAVKLMFGTSVDMSKKFSSSYCRDYKRLSDSLKELSLAFQSGTAWRNSLGLNEALKTSGLVYGDISKLYEDQPKNDFEPLADMLHQYRGLLSGWPEVLQLHKHATQIRNDQEKALTEERNDQLLANINQRTNVTTYVALAEINHFHNERLVDFKQIMQAFLKSQIKFHTDILRKLETALIQMNDA